MNTRINSSNLAQRVKQLATQIWLLIALVAIGAEPTGGAEAKNPSVDTHLDADHATIAIQAEFKGKSGSEDKVIYGAVFQHAVKVASDRLDHTIAFKVDAIQGSLREILVTLSGEGEIKQVTGNGLEDWSVRQAGPDHRYLVLRVQKAEKPTTSFSGQIVAETRGVELGKVRSALALTVEPSTLANGFIRIDTEAGLDIQLSNPTGLVPIETAFLPEGFKSGVTNSLAYRFLGTPYSLPMVVAAADPEARNVVLSNFNLVGQLSETSASFTLNATARIKNPKGGTVELLSGGLALTEVQPQNDWRMTFQNGRFLAAFDKAGEFPITVGTQWILRWPRVPCSQSCCGG